MSRQRILFVDDEPNLIEGLKRMMRKEHEHWDVDFATNGDQALSKCKDQPFDVVVSDMLMPGMNGAELLEHVMVDYPTTVRIALSAHGSMKSNTRAIQVAHQFLYKPADVEMLKDAIARASSMRDMIFDDRICAVVAGFENLPTVPSLYTDLNKAAQAEDPNANKIVDLIERDPAISARILQLCKSSIYGFAGRISSIENAVELLGITRLIALVLTEHIAKQLMPPRDYGILTRVGFWSHSLMVGEVARAISQLERQGDDRSDQAFTAGVLHDIGKLVLASQKPHAFKTVFDRALEEKKTACEMELEIMGTTHAEIGGYLLALWGLPPRIVEAVALHHSPSGVSYDGLCVLTVVHAANSFVSSFQGAQRHGVGNPWASELDRGYIERIGVKTRIRDWMAEARRLWARQVENPR